MSQENEMSPGELGRLIGRLEGSIDKGFAEVKRDLGNYVLKSVHEAEVRRIDADIDDLKGDIQQNERRRKEAEDAATSRQRWVAGLLVTILLTLGGLALTFWQTFGPPQL